jgi:hypothetical protein
MAETTYIGKFQRVVALMRKSGSYTATLDTTDVYIIASNVKSFVAVKDYIRLEEVPVRVVEVVDYKTFKVKVFSQVIALAGTWFSLAPYSDFGTRKMIDRKLMEKNGGEHAYKKYPLIALRLPAPISTVDGVSTIEANILIANFTTKTYKPDERYNNVFIPILYPLMYKFFEMLRKSGEFLSYENDYTQIDRLFYGSESGDEQNIANVFTDPLDAIEIRNLKLTFLAEQCPTFEPVVGEIGGFEYAFEQISEL